MIDQLIHRIKVRQAELQVSLAVGNAPNWETYQRIVGNYQGLQDAMDIIDNMLEEEKRMD
jgi:hypothetical protein